MWHYAPLFAVKPKPAKTIHQAVIDQMGGERWWRELIRDLNQARKEFTWNV